MEVEEQTEEAELSVENTKKKEIRNNGKEVPRKYNKAKERRVTRAVSPRRIISDS